MSGAEVNRSSRPKKAGGNKNGGAASGGNKNIANLKFANKKKSKERQQNNSSKKMDKSSKSSGCCSRLIFWLFWAGIGASVAFTYRSNPDKFQEFFEKLPPQVQSGFIQARDMSCDTYGIVSTKSVQIYGQGVVMVKEGYAMLPPKVLEFTDPALEATVKYSTVAYDKSKEMYNQAAIVILEQYKIHSPTMWIYVEKAKIVTVDLSSKALENGAFVLDHTKVWISSTYEKVSPEAMIYFDQAKDSTKYYGHIVLVKIADLSSKAIDLTAQGIEKIKPHVKVATDKIGTILAPYLGQYWEIFYNSTAEHYYAGIDRARLISREINIGDVNLERLLFAEELEQEELDQAKKAAEKIKAAVEAMNKKIEATKAAQASEAAEGEAKLKAEADAKLKAEAEAKLKAEAEAKLKAEAEAKLKAEAVAKLKAEAEAKKKAEAEAKLKSEAEAKKKAEAEAKLKAAAMIKAEVEAQAKKKAEEVAKLKAEYEVKKKAEAEAEAKKKAEAETKLKAEAESKKKAEAKLKAEAEAKLRAEADAKLKAEAEIKKKAEAEGKLKAETEAKKKDAEAERRKKAEAETLAKNKKADDEAKLKAEAEAKNKKEFEETQKRAQEMAVKEAEEARKLMAEYEKGAKKPKAGAGDETPSSSRSQLDRKLELLAIKLDNAVSISSNDPKSKESQLDLLNGEIDIILEVKQLSLSEKSLAFFVKAGVLEEMASLKKSNSILDRSIHFYREILFLGPQIDGDLTKLAGEKCVKLMEFRGFQSKAVRIWQILITRFEGNLEYRRGLGVLYLTMNRNEPAKEVFKQLLEIDGNDGFALAHLGFIFKQEALEANDDKLLEKSVELMSAGIDTKVELKGLFYFHLGDALRRLGRPKEADKIYQIAADRQIFPSFWQRSLYNEPNLKAQPVWPLSETQIGPQLGKIQRHWESIRDEALAVLDSKTGGFVNEAENLQDTGYWAQFDLFTQGRKNEKNCEKAPLTCTLIEAIPAVRNNRRGQVKFSVMKSGTHVFAHSGPTNCRLRVHLGLKIPPQDSNEKSKEKGTILRVADEYLQWKNGEMFVFDDSFDHEVWHTNDKNESRMVLILDLWHPDLSLEQRETLPAI